MPDLAISSPGQADLLADGEGEGARVRPWLKAAAFYFLALTLTGLLTYGPAAWLEYGRADDYWFVLHNAVDAPQANARNLVEGGRFVAALISRWIFPHVDTVPELWQMRLAAIVALSLAGTALSLMALRLTGQPRARVLRGLALLVGVTALVTPSAPSAATWGVMALELWAMPLALIGGLCATVKTHVLGVRWELVAGALIFTATFTYQPASSASLLPVFMWTAFRWARNEPPEWRRPIVVVAILVTSLACDLATVKFLDLAASSRIGAHSPDQTLMWLVEFMVRTVAIGVPTTTASAGFTLLALVPSMLAPVLLGRRFLALPVAVGTAWFLASCLLMFGDQFASYRQVMTAQTMLWAGSLVCVASTVSEWPKSRREGGSSPLGPVIGGVVIAGALGLAGLSSYRAYFFLARPNAVDWASVRCVLAHSPPLTRESVLVLTPLSATTSPVRSSDEYGMIATNLSWALPDITWLAAESVGPSGLPPRVHPNQLRVVRGSSDEASAQGALRFKQDACGSVFGTS